MSRISSIPEPTDDVRSLRASVLALKEVVELLTRQRGFPIDSVVTWKDLVRLGKVEPGQVPTKADSFGA